MRRWATERIKMTVDHEPMKIITIYAEESNKIAVKKDNPLYSYKRMLLIPNENKYTIRG